MATTFSEEQSYSLANCVGPIRLEVSIGFAQVAATRVRINNVVYNVPPADMNSNYRNSFEIVLGPPTDLLGKPLTLTCTVTRIQKNEPNTSMSIKLIGGAATKTFPVLSEPVNIEGDIVTYYPKIQFN